MKTLKNIILITVPTLLVVFLILEVVFRFIIPASNVPDSFFDNENRVLKFSTSGNTSGYATFGKSGEHRFKWAINNHGWNSSYNYQTEKTAKNRIVVIGDSYIEGFQVNNSERYPELLNNQLSDQFEVYSFGMSGAPLSQYLHLSRYANKLFDPDLLIINLVHNDFDESVKEINGRPYFLTLTVKDTNLITENLPLENASRVKPIRRFLKRSALVRYIIYNLRLGETLQAQNVKNENKVFNANIDVDAVRAQNEKISIAMDYILKAFKNENPDTRVIFVVDAPRADLYEGTLATSNVIYLNDLVEKYCSKYGLEYVDMTPVFEQDFQVKHQKFNADFDFHWDAYGHQIVSQHLAKIITNKADYQNAINN